MALRLLYREATAEQLAWLQAQGAVVTSAEMRAMARDPADQANAALVELKGVSPAYPLYGTVALQTADGGTEVVDIQQVLATRDGVGGAVVEPVLAERLGLSVGSRVRIGETEVELRGLIAREPD